MSVTVHSLIVDPDDLIPRGEHDEGSDLGQLTPWVFEHAHIADSDCTEFWPYERQDFRDFFWRLNSYYAELNEASEKHITRALKETETIILPMKNWKVPRREYFANLMRSQGMLLRVLVETVYRKLKNHGLETQLHFPVSGFKQTYVIGGKRYASRPDGAAMVGPQERRLPILSFAGWYEGQTWGEFLAEILSIMLGQLARNRNVDSRDQEAFIIGFHGRYVYIARGYFTSELISRAHLKGCTEDETIKIQFTRGYDLSLKEDWLEAMNALARLLRYLLSENAEMKTP
ncbi:hypothetical protein BDV24DRAFT_146198 [Aspergillus arachidicola]|uniref:Uncharacterized protein n=1 Tax=Aspergillus arachidicola TaxID=656916 RepID=A0A5N6XLU9_9EURO|nr:hypothetical protein BDV24DRAFT_146198 [Aspergillus arachidicola]